MHNVDMAPQLLRWPTGTYNNQHKKGVKKMNLSLSVLSLIRLFFGLFISHLFFLCFFCVFFVLLLLVGGNLF